MQAVDQPAVTQPPGSVPRLGTGAGLAPEPLARLLQQWGVPPVPAQPLAPALGGQLGWADAILLSQTLSTPIAPAPANESARQSAADWVDSALERLLSESRAGFNDPVLARESAEPLAKPLPLADALAPYRLHHAQQQRSIAMRVASLRQRLRERVADGSPALARLSALDAVFDRALATHERQSLAGLPALLTRRAEAHAAADPRHWRARLWADLQRLLHAELELRLQPVLGLLDALDNTQHVDPTTAVPPSP
jgi:hypothetical protein